MHAVHNGEAAGLPGRLLAAISGLGAASLFVTGVVRFLHKRHARVLAGRKAAGRAPRPELSGRNVPARWPREARLLTEGGVDTWTRTSRSSGRRTS